MEATSELGTKSYWASAYDAELVEFRARADCGEVWFGEETQATMVSFVAGLVDESGRGRAELRVLDLGCGKSPQPAAPRWRLLSPRCVAGNGALCVALAQAGCALRALPLHCSAHAVQLRAATRRRLRRSLHRAFAGCRRGRRRLLCAFSGALLGDCALPTHGSAG